MVASPQNYCQNVLDIQDQKKANMVLAEWIWLFKCCNISTITNQLAAGSFLKVGREKAKSFSKSMNQIPY